MPDAFDDLDRLTLEIIGDPVTFAPASGQPRTITAFVDHRPDIVSFGFSEGVSIEAAIQVRKIDIAVPDRAGDRYTLPRTGKRYKMSGPALDSQCGRLWNIALVTTEI